MVGDMKDSSGSILRFAEPNQEVREEKGFGATISRSDARRAPANEQVIGFLDRLIIDKSLPVYVSSIDGTLLHVNEKFEALCTKMGDGVLAPGPMSVMGRAPAPSLQPIIDDVVTSGTTIRAEEKITFNGKEHVLMGRHMPVCNELGEIVAIAGTYEDVTRQLRGLEDANKTQARFQDFARASSDWFWEINGEMKISTLSDRFTAIVGQPAIMFIGSRFEQFGRYDTNLEGRNDGAVALVARKPFRDQLFLMEDLDGNEHRFHLSGVPVFDRSTGDFSGYRGVGKDVSQRYKQADKAQKARGQLEEALTDLTRNNIALDVATQQAQAALKAKNEFLAAMSHELRTPLNAIIGFAESFVGEQFGPLQDDYKNFATDIHSSGQHLLELINDILDVAVMESGGLSLRSENIPLQQLIDKAMHMNAGRAEEKKLQVLGQDIKTDLYIRSDERRTIQILVNLLSNAIKFTPDEGRIGMMVADTEDGFVDVTVWDTGVGIAKDQQSKVFEKFHQVVDNIYSRNQEGTGLGLHISRGLARAMDGDIRLESVEGQGCRFTLSIPKGDANAIDDFDFI